MNKEKLSEIIIDETLNVDILLEIVRRFIRVNPQKHQIIPLTDFFKLKEKDKVIIILLGFKVLKELKARDKELVGPKEVADSSNINPSTVKNSLRDLEKEGLAKSEKGKYFIPNVLLYVLKDRFSQLTLERESFQKGKRKKQRGVKVDFSRISKILETNPEKFAGVFYEFLTTKRGEYLKKSLILIKLAKEKFNIDGLTTAEITKLLKNYLRVPMIHQSNISTAVGARGTSKYLIKEPTTSKKVYRYKLTKLGEDFVNNINLHLKERKL